MNLYSDKNHRIAILPEALGLFGIPLVGRLSQAQASSPLDMHIHPGIIEIVYLHRGHQVYQTTDESFALEGQDVFVAYPDEVHGSGFKPEEKSVLYWIQIDLNFKNCFLGLNTELSNKLITQISSISPRRFKGNPLIKTIFEDIISQASAPINDLTPIILQSQLIRLLTTMISSSKSPAILCFSPDIADTVEFIKDNADRINTISELARRVNLSESRFKQKFKNETGFPPMEYILRHKINESCHQLRTTNRSVTDISISLGFSSSQYFSEVFKKYTGRSPIDFRNDRQ